MTPSRRHCAHGRDSEGKLIMTARPLHPLVRLTLLAGLICVAFTGAAGAQQPSQAQADAIRQSCRGDYQAHCAGVPTGGSCRAAMSAAQSGEPVVALPDRCQRDRGRERAARRCLAGQAGTLTGDGSADDAARGGRADASLLRRRFPRLVPRRGSGRRQGDGVPGRPSGEPLAALPRGDGGGSRRSIGGGRRGRNFCRGLWPRRLSASDTARRGSRADC